MRACHRLEWDPERSLLAAAFADLQPRPVVRLPAVVTEPRYFDVSRDVLLDLTETRVLERDAVRGLNRLLREYGAQRLLLAPGPVRETLRTLYAGHLRPLPGGEWEIRP